MWLKNRNRSYLQCLLLTLKMGSNQIVETINIRTSHWDLTQNFTLLYFLSSFWCQTFQWMRERYFMEDKRNLNDLLLKYMGYLSMHCSTTGSPEMGQVCLITLITQRYKPHLFVWWGQKSVVLVCGTPLFQCPHNDVANQLPAVPWISLMKTLAPTPWLVLSCICMTKQENITWLKKITWVNRDLLILGRGWERVRDLTASAFRENT